MACASFRFYGELNDFLPRKQRGQVVERWFDWRGNIKDMIESLGIPHAEIELIAVNDQSVGFETIVEDRDVVKVYPRFEGVEIDQKVRLRPPLSDPPRFVLDIHLGRLAAYLRMMGFDTIYGDTNNHDQDFADPALARLAHDEDRILLTRDIGLLKRSMVTYGYWVRSMKPRDRLVEIVERFELDTRVSPFVRCIRCNGLLEPVEKEQVLDQLMPDTARYIEVFRQCMECGQVYWRGMHTRRMQEIIDDVLAVVKSQRMSE
ncbi:MAG: Mut7-C ubiquitin/RNAse domain-containing protein [Anaerolineae bacterium]|nr:Mut7-C ubiquitin/RNAse domain-containing protein [Anaerolineae bacterium]